MHLNRVLPHSPGGLKMMMTVCWSIEHSGQEYICQQLLASEF